MEGILVFNQQEERYQLRLGLQDYSRCFRCGDPLEVEVDGEWVESAMEMKWADGGNQWYLVGIRTDRLDGLKARI